MTACLSALSFPFTRLIIKEELGWANAALHPSVNVLTVLCKGGFNRSTCHAGATAELEETAAPTTTARAATETSTTAASSTTTRRCSGRRGRRKEGRINPCLSSQRLAIEPCFCPYQHHRPVCCVPTASSCTSLAPPTASAATASFCQSPPPVLRHGSFTHSGCSAEPVGFRTPPSSSASLSPAAICSW